MPDRDRYQWDDCAFPYWHGLKRLADNDWINLEMEDFTMSTEAGIQSSIDARLATISR